MTYCNEYARLSRVLLRRAGVAFAGERIETQWRSLRFTAAPELDRAIEQYAEFEALIAATGAQLELLAEDDELTLDAIYVRDASVVTPRGIILCRMGKPLRAREPAAQRRVFEALGLPIVGTIESPGQLEGGDVVWFDEQTVAVGQGYRTNAAGIAQFRALVGAAVDVIVVPLPHHHGPDDVFHLMSMLSPVDHDLAVVYSPLLPVPFREWLLDRGIHFIEVPTHEFDDMGANVLALGPRRCVMSNGAPTTRARLEAAGAEVWAYEGSEISAKGGGGPTCLTRPLVRGR
jgi:N-dimethylarginine dimethylaminohydrolase